ncbi:hypothetical protein QBC39DRAFT_397122 [Podospora conica]|nr:hypothetical protein QBC39DRAFT_397122 [Schizothecium conicum]
MASGGESRGRRLGPGLAVHTEGTAPRFDMVLVHEVDGHQINTWKHEDGTFWPTQLDGMLHEYRAPRVLRFKCRTSSSRPFASQNIDNDSMKLLSQLSQQRRETGARFRPIIFIGHGTGGIIIKKALLVARSDPRYRGIFHLTYGNIFFATPHRGIRDTDPDGPDSLDVWKETVDRLYRANELRSGPVGRTPRRLFHDEDARYLMRISRDFIPLVEHNGLDVVSFTEGAVDNYIEERIVNESSAKLRINAEDVVPLWDRDHFQVCRFGKLDADLSLVCNHINKTAVSTAYKRDVYQNPRVNKLWIHGDEGCGKTNLAQHILGLLANPGQVPFPIDTVAYCSLDDIREGHKTSAKVLLCLLHEIFMARPELIAECLVPIDRQTQGEPPKIDFQNPDHIAWLWHSLLDVGTTGNHYLTLIIDAFDQCTDKLGVQQEFLRTIARQGNGKLRVLVLARQPIQAISRHLSPEFKTYEIKKEVTEVDIGVIVGKRVDLIARSGKVDMDEAFQQRVREDIAKGAAGIHVWAKVVMDEIQKHGLHSQEGIHAVLRALPSGMIGVYEGALSKVSARGHRAFVRNVLFWLAHQARPLGEEELKTGLMMVDAVDKMLQQSSRSVNRSVNRSQLPPRAGWTITRRDVEKSDERYIGLTNKISRECGELIRISRNGSFELVHRSLRDYLVEPTTLLEQKHTPVVQHKHYHEPDGQGLMARLCTEYLLLDYFRDAGLPQLPCHSSDDWTKWQRKVRRRIQKRPLCQYVAMHWLSHAWSPDKKPKSGLEAAEEDRVMAELLDVERNQHAICWAEVRWYCTRPPQMDETVHGQPPVPPEQPALADMVSHAVVEAEKQGKRDESPQREESQDQHPRGEENGEPVRGEGERSVDSDRASTLREKKSDRGHPI